MIRPSWCFGEVVLDVVHTLHVHLLLSLEMVHCIHVSYVTYSCAYVCAYVCVSVCGIEEEFLTCILCDGFVCTSRWNVAHVSVCMDAQ